MDKNGELAMTNSSLLTDMIPKDGLYDECTCELQGTHPSAVVSLQQGKTLQGLDVPDVDGWVSPNLNTQTANQKRSRLVRQ